MWWLAAQMRWVERETVTSLRTPSVIIHGETDGIIPVRKARELAAELPGSYLYILRQTGHQVMQERPSVTLDLIQSFVKKVGDGQWPPPPAWPPSSSSSSSHDVPVSQGSAERQAAHDIPVVHKEAGGQAPEQQHEEGGAGQQAVDGAGASPQADQGASSST